jgi:hypothetical protein
VSCARATEKARAKASNPRVSLEQEVGSIDRELSIVLFLRLTSVADGAQKFRIGKYSGLAES